MQKKVESLQSVVTKSSVNSVLDMVRQLASRPSALVDPYALVAALEQLADVSVRQITRSVDDFRPFSNSVDPLSESLSLQP